MGALSLSAAAFAGLVSHEGWTEKAMVPTQGDRPTVGFGSTFRHDGSPVRMGDKINPVQAVQRSLAHIEKDELGIKGCVTAPLTQIEYDTMVGFAYQYGVQALCHSSIVRRVNAHDYKGSCQAYLLYRYAAGFDCSTPGNRRCPGVWTRSQERYSTCMGQL